MQMVVVVGIECHQLMTYLGARVDLLSGACECLLLLLVIFYLLS